MNDELVDVRLPLARSATARVEIGRDGVLHVLAGPVTIHMDRARCEELTTTLARAMVALSKMDRSRTPELRLIPGLDTEPDDPASHSKARTRLQGDEEDDPTRNETS